MAAVPPQQTFWVQRFGAGADRFGVPYGITCDSGK
jgi:uncharacterized glyoxalase superfamily protein PhnB